MSMAKLEAGAAAPPFTLPDQDGTPVSLEDFKGNRVLVYFYPADDTPGCTKEACGFRDQYEDLKAAGAEVIGVSSDAEASHEKFKSKYDLPFTLLADTDHSVADAYGVWGEKSYAGKTYMGVKRSTFVIDAEGTLAKAFHDVKPAEHADQVLEALSA